MIPLPPPLGIFLYLMGGLVWATAVQAGHTTLTIAMPVAGIVVFIVWLKLQDPPDARSMEAAP